MKRKRWKMIISKEWKFTVGKVWAVQIPFCNKFCWTSQTNIVGLFALSLRISFRSWAVKRGRFLLDGIERFRRDVEVDGIDKGGGKEKFIGGMTLKNDG